MRRPRILLVDDDRDIVRALSVRLRAAGYDIATAHDGLAGVAAAESTQPDAIVLDIRMPGMDGLSALARLRAQKQTKEIPVVVLSANVAERTRHKALDLGARYFLEKPCEQNTLIQAIRSAIGEAQCSAESTANADG